MTGLVSHKLLPAGNSSFDWSFEARPKVKVSLGVNLTLRKSKSSSPWTRLKDNWNTVSMLELGRSERCVGGKLNGRIRSVVSNETDLRPVRPGSCRVTKEWEMLHLTKQ